MMSASRMVALVLVAGPLTLLASSCSRKVPSADMLRGQQAYLAYCAMCHGDTGAGDGPLAATLATESGAHPAQLDLASRLDALGRAGVRKIIIEGGGHLGRSNLMPAWGEKLDPALVNQITDYVMALPTQKQAVPAATIQKYLQAPPGTPEEGRRLFVYYCSGCHGPEGKGDGFNADSLRIRHNVRPRDLTDASYFKDKTDEQLYATISLGGGHTGKSVYMPAWTYTLSPEQIKDLVSYVRATSHTESKP